MVIDRCTLHCVMRCAVFALFAFCLHDSTALAALPQSALALPRVPPAITAPLHGAPNATTANAWTVNSVADTNDGVCDGSSCTLREAMSVAQPGDTIQFSSLFSTPQTINLGSALPDISADLTIIGPGADLLTVRANASGFTILLINSGVVTISGLTIADGNADYAGGINNFGSLTLTDSVLAGNHANFNGGGLQNAGTLQVVRSTISGNSAGFGAGLFNFAAGTYAGNATLINVTISGNSSGSGGNAIENDLFAGATGTPSTTLTNCTLAGNTGGAYGIFVYDEGAASTVSLKNTMLDVAGTPSIGSYGTFSHATSLGNNLANDSGGGFLTGSGDLINVDPQLTALGNFGGHTPVHLLALNSPAVDAGNGSGAPAIDQRGVPRPQGGNVDIGAVELRPLVINSIADPGDGICDSSCTLRDAILASNSDGASADDLFFSSVFDTPRVINLTGALPDVAGDLTLNGPGANLLTVRRDTGGDYTVLVVDGGVAAHLFGLTIANGSAVYGGGVDNYGSLTIDRSTLTGNLATVNGGGIQNTGSLILTNSTVSGNSAGYGAGLYNYSEGACSCTASVINTTFSGNDSANQTGGIFDINFGGNAPTVNVANSTIAGNAAPNFGGVLVYDAGGPATISLKNTIVADNQSQNLASVGAGAQLVSLGHNLANDDGSGFLVGPGDLPSTNPLLATLSNYGGSTQTLFLKPGSPAIDAGDDSGAPTTDQRGVVRPQGAHVDIGAVESDGTLIFQNGFEGQ